MAGIQEALEAGDFYVAYQPIFDLKKKKTFSFEALVRSRNDAFPHPGVIIEEALKANFMGVLGRELRKMAVDGCPDYSLFLNVHPNEFDESWLVRPDDLMNSHDHDVYMEITESVPLSHYKHCKTVVAEVRRRGIMVAIDDLGAGYSNLKYIADLEPEIVKIDRGLIAGVKRGSRQQRLVKAIVELCQSQGARVVVEGIEDAEEMRVVMDSGADFAQGFFLGRPKPELIPVVWENLKL